jgi:hypothetical protein
MSQIASSAWETSASTVREEGFSLSSFMNDSAPMNPTTIISQKVAFLKRPMQRLPDRRENPASCAFHLLQTTTMVKLSSVPTASELSMILQTETLGSEFLRFLPRVGTTMFTKPSYFRKHVFRDIRPYVCTFKGCSQATHLFERRHDWFYHERDVHRREWVCSCCHRAKTFGSKASFRTHLNKRIAASTSQIVV